jgi:hypothetical protein
MTNPYDPPVGHEGQPPPMPPMQGPPPSYYYGLPQVARQSTNGLAVASLVLGIVWVYWIGSILALVFGYIAKRQIDQSNGAQGGRGLAVAGIVLGWVGVGFLTLFIVLVIASRAANS